MARITAAQYLSIKEGTKVRVVGNRNSNSYTMGSVCTTTRRREGTYNIMLRKADGIMGNWADYRDLELVRVSHNAVLRALKAEIAKLQEEYEWKSKYRDKLDFIVKTAVGAAMLASFSPDTISKSVRDALVTAGCPTEFEPEPETLGGEEEEEQDGFLETLEEDHDENESEG